MEEAERNRIPITAIMSVREVFEHPHFRERGAFAAIDHPVVGRLEYSGAPFRMARGYALRRPAPLLDQHRDEILAELEHATATSGARRDRRGRTAGPLDGIRVVDLTVVWSGPGGTALLGDLGAEVIRVEGNDRISRQVSAKVTKESIAAAGYHGGTYPDKDPGARPYDRTALFNWHARNKLAACMNLDTPEGHRAMLDLLAVSDVLVENNSPGVLEKLGLGHELLTELFPRLGHCPDAPLGLTGEMSGYLGYGPNFNSLVGIASLDGYTGEGPESAGENYHMDEAAPAGLAFAVLVALWDRETTGRGAVIEFSQAENVMAEIGEYLVDLQRSGQSAGGARQYRSPTVPGCLPRPATRRVSSRSRCGSGTGRRSPACSTGRTGHGLPAPEEQAQRREALRDWLAVLTPRGRGEHSAGGPDPGR